MEQKLEEPAQENSNLSKLIVLDTKDILEILDHVEKLDPLDRMGAMDKILQCVQLEVDPLVYAKLDRYEKITEQRRESVKKWQKKNKEQVRVWQKKYAQKEKERFVQYAKNYQMENKDKYNEYQVKYRGQLKEYNKIVKVFKQLPFQNE